MKMRKILAITICILMIFALASCEQELTLEEKIAKATLSAAENPFAITTVMNYSCDDPNMKATFDAMSGMEMVDVVIHRHDIACETVVCHQRCEVSEN